MRMLRAYVHCVVRINISLLYLQMYLGADQMQCRC